MSRVEPTAEKSDLSQWLLNLFRKFEKNRSSLETKWNRNRDAYKGITSGSWKKKSDEDWQSDAMVPVTKQKVLFAYAVAIGQMLQGGKMPYALSADPEELMEYSELSEDEKAAADDHREDMKKLIDTQLDHCKAAQHLAHNVLAGALYGMTWAKKSIGTRQAKRYVQASEIVTDEEGNETEQAVWQLEKFEEDTPEWLYVSNWNMYWDMESEDIQSGLGVIERETMGKWELHKMSKENDFFIEDAVKRAIDAAGKGSADGEDGDVSESISSLPPYLRDINHRSNTLRYLECNVRAPRKMVERFEATLERDDEEELISETAEDSESHDLVLIHVCLAGDHIVRFVRMDEDDDNDDIPYFKVPWEEDVDEAEPNGVADNLESVQRVMNDAIRRFEENKEFASRLIFGLKRRGILNKIDGQGFKPGATVDLSEDIRNISEAITAFETPDVGDSLISLFNLFDKIGDEASNIPKISQGFDDGANTAYEASIRNQNSGQYMS
ncbi:hypothetical protein BVY04_00115, partial [bacterium M21]